jgi:SAM-dependent methyltransferase
MTEVFGSVLASAYDSVYREKDYERECDLVERILKLNQMEGAQTILDLGCGTGNHALLLAERGHDVVGADRSGDMLIKADEKRQKSTGRDRLTLLEADLKDLRLNRHFDVVLMMFNVFGYQLGNKDVGAALETVRTHLRPGGIFVFDCWYGPAVLSERPMTRFKQTVTEQGELLRVSSGTLDVAAHTCLVTLEVWEIENTQVVSHGREEHPVRFFFPLELQLLLETHGLALIESRVFPSFDQPPSEREWNMINVARK